MLYIYKDKIYIKPFDNKLIEVKITKKNGEYNVEATEKTLEISEEVRSNMMSISLEQAYDIQNKGKEKDSKDFILD